MRKLTIAMPIAIAALAALGGTAGAAQTTVTVGNNFFAPANKTISAGTKVKFRWTGGERHHIKKTSGPGKGFQSPATAVAGVNLVRRLSKSGAYRLICTIHPVEMRLKLTVR